MRIGIVTVFYTENCGSVLQAAALADKLSERGNDVFFIDTRNELSGHSLKRLIKNCAKAILKGKLPFGSIKKYLNYSNYIKSHFAIIDNRSPVDMIVIGSDTVWDVTSDYFLLSQNIFWCIDNDRDNIVTYAASISNSPYEKLNELKYPAKCLRKYKHVSVRDRYTKDYVDKYLTEPSLLVCDPTLLHTKEYYQKMCYDLDERNYILLYLFNEPDKQVMSSIREYADETNCKIISMICMGKRISGADIYVESTVDNFLTYYSNAACVVTNTFHGTVFSVIFNKPFVVLDYNKQKITEFLKSVALSDRLTQHDIKTILQKEINYDEVNNYLEDMRRTSETYFDTILS